MPLLVNHFLVSAAARFGREPLTVSPEALERLQRSGWPGNVRDLENCIERAVVLCRTSRIGVEDLPPKVRLGADGDGGFEGFRLPADGVRLPDLEGYLIRQALERSRGNLGRAARLLGISYKTLQYRVRKHGLEREEFAEDL